MLRNILLGLTILGSSVSGAAAGQAGANGAGPGQKAASPALRPTFAYAEVSRVPEAGRRAIFTALVACRSAVNDEAAALYPEMNPRSAGYSVKAEVKRFKQRGQFQDAGSAECAARIMKTYGLQPDELRSMMLEGVSRGWTARTDPAARQPAKGK
jgi:hypothetical protein